MSSTLFIYETEQGDPITINAKQSNGSSNSDLTWVVEADCTIEIKEKDEIIATLTGTTDFTISGSVITWTPTDAQIGLLTKKISYECFIHARNNGTPRERVLKFNLKLLDS